MSSGGIVAAPRGRRLPGRAVGCPCLTRPRERGPTITTDTPPHPTDPVEAWNRKVRQLADPANLKAGLRLKIQTGSTAVAYIDARYVASVLDKILGPAGWSFELLSPALRPIETDEGRWMKPGKDGKPPYFSATWTTHGRLTLHGPDGLRIIREDVGSGTGDQENGAKGASSDALKRCAAQLGVGRAVYALPKANVRKQGYGQINPEDAARVLDQHRAQLDKWHEAFVKATGGEEPAPEWTDEEPAAAQEEPAADGGQVVQHPAAADPFAGLDLAFTGPMDQADVDATLTADGPAEGVELRDRVWALFTMHGGSKDAVDATLAKHSMTLASLAEPVAWDVLRERLGIVKAGQTRAAA